MCLFYFVNKNRDRKKNQLHFVSRTQQGRQRELSVKTVPHFLPNSGGIACWVAELNAALAQNETEKMKMKKYAFLINNK